MAHQAKNADAVTVLETPSQVARREGIDLNTVAKLIDKHAADPKFLDWVCTFAHWKLDEFNAN